MKALFNNARIKEAAEFIRAELRTFLNQTAGFSIGATEVPSTSDFDADTPRFRVSGAKIRSGCLSTSKDSKNSRCHEVQNQGNGEAVGSVGRRTRLRSPRPRHSRQLPLTRLSPRLQFLLGVMRDPKAPIGLRVQVARAAAPLVHGKLKIASVEDRAGYAGAIGGPDGFKIDMAEAKAFRDMEHRRLVLMRKHFRRENCTLTAAEIREESNSRH